MAAASHLTKLIKNASTPIHFISGKDEHGREAYYYLMCSVQKINLLKAAQDLHVDLHNYGQIIASGWGKEAPPEVKAMLKNKYDYDADELK